MGYDAVCLASLPLPLLFFLNLGIEIEIGDWRLGFVERGRKGRKVRGKRSALYGDWDIGSLLAWFLALIHGGLD